MGTTRPSRQSLAEIPELDVTRARALGRGLRRDRKLGLRSLREASAKTQIEVAAAARMDQGDVSKLEHKDDALISTLRRYVRALGGELDLVAVFPKTGHRIRIDL